MKLFIYSLFDSAASAFTQPFFLQTDGIAVRMFQDNVNAKEENNISLHPDQFTLFKLGEFDDKTGQFNMLETPKSLGLGVELIEDKKYSDDDLKPLQEEVKFLREQLNNFIQEDK